MYKGKKNFKMISYMALSFSIILLSVISVKSKPVDNIPVYGGLLTMGGAYPKSVWEPTYLIPGIEAVPAVYDQLFEYDVLKGPRGTREQTFSDFNFVSGPAITGQVIESYKIHSPTYHTWKVRRGIHYHNKPPANGREMTREDVIHTWKVVTAEPKAALMYKADEFIQMKAWPHDDWTIEVTLSIPDTLGRWNYIITSLNGVLPKEYLDDKTINKEDWRNTMGSGPWMVVNDDGSSWTYKKNPDYWMHDPFHPKNKLPYLDEIKVVNFKDNAARLAAIRTGKLDRNIQPGLNPTDMESLEKTNPEIKYGPAWLLGQYSTVRADLKPWSDIRVRQAAMLATNHEELKEFFNGHFDYPAFPAKISAGSPNWLSKEELDKVAPDVARLYEYHPDEAEKLLDDAGYPRGSDGIRFKTTLVGSDVTAENYQAFMSYLEAVGIQVENTMMDHAAHYSVIHSADGPSDDIYTGLGAHCHGGTGIGFLPVMVWNAPWRPYYSMGRVDGTPASNRLKKLWNDVNVETDPDKQAQLYQDLHLFWMKELWFLDHGSVNTYMTWQPWVKGMDGMAGYATARYHFAKYFWIDANLKKKLSGRDANE